jgi:hypothetical protein
MKKFFLSVILGSLTILTIALLSHQSDDSAYAAARTAHTMAGYEQFLLNYPTSEYVDSAYTALYQLLRPTVEGLRYFYEHYPLAPQAPAALAQVCDSLYAGALAANTIDAWKQFVLETPVGYQRDAQERLAELLRWGTDDSAWAYVASARTDEACETYLKKYPRGQHAKACRKLRIDLRIEHILAGDYGELPPMEKTFLYHTQLAQGRSIVEIENSTGYRLTVLYGGERESRELEIADGKRKSLSLPNGKYTITASVSDATISNYAGCETLTGDTYSVTFYIYNRFLPKITIPDFYERLSEYKRKLRNQ